MENGGVGRIVYISIIVFLFFASVIALSLMFVSVKNKVDGTLHLNQSGNNEQPNPNQPNHSSGGLSGGGGGSGGGGSSSGGSSESASSSGGSGGSANQNNSNNSGGNNSLPSAPNEIIIWHHSYGENSNNIVDIGASNFVSHMIIENLPYESQQTSSVAEKVNLALVNNLVPIWERKLWPDQNQQIDRLYDSDYYYNFLNELHAEAQQYGIEFVAADVSATGQIEGLIQQDNATSVARIRDAIQTAISLGAEKADYIYPVDSYSISNNGYVALADLGENKITTQTYLECAERLDWAVSTNTDVLGLWGTSILECHSVDDSCTITTDCPYTQQQPLWSVQNIFDNANYWRNASPPRGLFILTLSQGSDSQTFAQELREYCDQNSATCNTNGF